MATELIITTEVSHNKVLHYGIGVKAKRCRVCSDEMTVLRDFDSFGWSPVCLYCANCRAEEWRPRKGFGDV